MAGPWEDYQTPAQAAPAPGPWTDYATPAPATPVAEEPGLLSRVGRYADNTVRQAAQGVTFGYMDEISAGLRTGGGLWGNYGEALAAERARDAGFRRDNPVAATVANIAGGVASPIARALPFLNPGRAASLPAAVMRGAGAGAASGAVAGFGEGEGGLQNRAGGAMVGAGVGAALGGALPLVTAGAGAAAGAVGRRLGLTSGAPDAERILLRDLGRDGVTPDELLRRTQESAAAGRPEVLADLAGENVRGTAAAIARAPGQGRQAAADLVTARGGRAQGERLAQEVQRAVSGEDFRATANDIVARRSAAAQPAYERAWRIELTPDEFQRVAPMVNDRIGQDAMQRGLRVLELEHLATGRPFDPAAYGVRRTGEGWVPAEGAAPNMRLMDAVKRGYDQIVEDFRDQFGVLRLNEYGRAVNQVRAAYRNELAGMFPPYRRALESWSGPSGTLDAMGMGRRLLSEGAEASDITANQIARMPAERREAFRIGVARGLTDRIEGAADGAELTRLRQMYGTPRVRERLRAAFDSDADFQSFSTALDAEARMAATNRAVSPSGGSQTAPLQERMADLRNPPGGGSVVDANRQAVNGSLVPDLLRAGTGGGITAPLFRIGERVQQNMQQSRLERNMDALAPMLFGRDPAAREQVARALMARALGDQHTQQVINPRIRAIARGLAVGGAIEAND